MKLLKRRIFSLSEGQKKQFGVDSLQNFGGFSRFDILLTKRLIDKSWKQVADWSTMKTKDAFIFCISTWVTFENPLIKRTKCLQLLWWSISLWFHFSSENPTNSPVWCRFIFFYWTENWIPHKNTSRNCEKHVSTSFKIMLNLFSWLINLPII